MQSKRPRTILQRSKLADIPESKKPEKGDIIIITKRAIWLVCQKCSHGWFYTSNKRKAICKECGTSVRTGIGR